MSIYANSIPNQIIHTIDSNYVNYIGKKMINVNQLLYLEDKYSIKLMFDINLSYTSYELNFYYNDSLLISLHNNSQYGDFTTYSNSHFNGLVRIASNKSLNCHKTNFITLCEKYCSNLNLDKLKNRYLELNIHSISNDKFDMSDLLSLDFLNKGMKEFILFNDIATINKKVNKIISDYKEKVNSVVKELDDNFQKEIRTSDFKNKYFKNLIKTELSWPLKDQNYNIFPDNVGSFGYKRKHDIHTGVDIYCKPNSEVLAIEDGIVQKIEWFTGKNVTVNGIKTTWWNDTKAIFIKSKSGYWCYGEVSPNSIFVNVGDEVKCGQSIAKIIEPVVFKPNERPNVMLHVELYSELKEDKDGNNSVFWGQNEEKPQNLLDPTPILKALSTSKFSLKNYNGNVYNVKSSAIVLLKTKDNEIIFLKRSKDNSYLPNLICAPGGKIKSEDKTLLDTAKRELFEETGLSNEFSISEDLYFSSVSDDNQYHINVFIGRQISDFEIKLSKEHDKYYLLTKDKLPFYKNKITPIAYAKALDYLSEE